MKKTSRQVAAAARLGRRADQSGGLGVVSPRRRRRPLPDRRHLVADRDRRHPDHAAARRDRAEARLGDAAASSASSRRSSTARASVLEGAAERQSRASPIPGRARCAPSTATTSASSRPISRPIPGKYFTGDGCRRDADGYYWITGRVDDVHQRLRPPHGHRRGRERAGRASEGRRRPRSSAIRTTSRARASTPT